MFIGKSIAGIRDHFVFKRHVHRDFISNRLTIGDTKWLPFIHTKWRIHTYKVEKSRLTEISVNSMIFRERFAESGEKRMSNDHGEQIRIVQETVAGKEITFAHVMGGPAPIIYQKLGLNPQLDYRSSAIGIMNMTPPESAVIASDIAVKSGNVYLGFADRFTGTLIITGEISDVTSALTEIVDYFRDSLGYVVCRITKR